MCGVISRLRLVRAARDVPLYNWVLCYLLFVGNMAITSFSWSWKSEFYFGVSWSDIVKGAIVAPLMMVTALFWSKPFHLMDAHLMVKPERWVEEVEKGVIGGWA